MTPSNDSILLRRCDKSAAGLSGANADRIDFLVFCGGRVVFRMFLRRVVAVYENVQYDFS